MKGKKFSAVCLALGLVLVLTSLSSCSLARLGNNPTSLDECVVKNSQEREIKKLCGEFFYKDWQTLSALLFAKIPKEAVYYKYFQGSLADYNVTWSYDMFKEHYSGYFTEQEFKDYSKEFEKFEKASDYLSTAE
ncbi:MAG: hypothetical protein WCJ33_05415 [Pseudomonadota bacterium]